MVLKAPPFLMEVPGSIEGEVSASLPLADPSAPWLPAVYADGSKRLVDLKTALLEAHHIDRFELGHTVITHSLYRLLLALVYGVLYHSEEFPDRASDFASWQRDALENNTGFNASAVEAYFEAYADRFFLVHPRLPFLQDPSLYRYAATDALAYSTESEVRQAFVKAAKNGSTVSQVHPLVASYETTAKCHQWGLAPEIFLPTLPAADKTSAMFGALMYQRSSLGSIGRGERTFINDSETPAKDTHSTIGPLRRVVHYLPATGSLFRDLAIAVQHVPFEKMEGSAEWERPVDANGWLMGTGQDAGDRSLWLTDAENPREAMNDSQMSILFAPQPDGGFAVIRRNRYRNNAAKQAFAASKEEQKARDALEKKWRKDRDAALKADPSHTPAPLPSADIKPDHLVPAWNPYIARRHQATNRPLSSHESISEETALSHADIMRVPLLSGRGTFRLPTWFDVFDSSRRDILDSGAFTVEVRVLVNGGKIDQDVDFNDFELSLPSTGAAVSTHTRDAIRAWMKTGDEVARYLSSRVEKAAALRRLDAAAMSSSAKRLFWAQYSSIFRAAVFGNQDEAVRSHEQEIVELALSCFDSATEVVRIQNPLRHAEIRHPIAPVTRKAVNENGI